MRRSLDVRPQTRIPARGLCSIAAPCDPRGPWVHGWPPALVLLWGGQARPDPTVLLGITAHSDPDVHPGHLGGLLSRTRA